MTHFKEVVNAINPADNKEKVVEVFSSQLEKAGYEVVEVNQAKPWGAYLRIANEDADQFIAEFFTGLDPLEARLGNPSIALSPKILIVSPNERLSWQYHHRRAERWCFLTEGSYNKSLTDEPLDPFTAASGEVVQFAAQERHRLNGLPQGFVVVAEIWQHIDEAQPSDEDDIIRLADDYSR